MKAIFAVLLLLFSAQTHAVERVLDFHREIRIARDGTLTVTEVMAVQAEGKQIRRGILRYGLSAGVLYWIERLLGPTGVKGDSVVAVAAPVDEEKAILLWYLTPSPEITQRIRDAGWEIKEMFRQ